jgi:hypothetical protein
MRENKLFEATQIQPAPKMGWRVVGVDPAPANKSTVCFSCKSGLAFRDLKHQELLYFIQSCEEEFKVLVVWDAPLTGPPMLDHSSTKKYSEGYFTKRWIEKYFTNRSGCKTPTGINTRSFSGLSHWTITKAFTGLPLLGPYCQKDQLPFNHLVSAKTELSEDKPNIVETHPAVAIYLWLKVTIKLNDSSDWTYKGKSGEKKEIKKTNLELFTTSLKSKIEKMLELDFSNTSIENDNKLDAFAAWALGCFFTEGKKDEVQILGDSCTGSMILPTVASEGTLLKDGFKKRLTKVNSPCRLTM